jgi:hypothetical protein
MLVTLVREGWGTDLIERWLMEQDPQEVSGVLQIQVVTADHTLDEDARMNVAGVYSDTPGAWAPGQLEAGPRRTRKIVPPTFSVIVVQSAAGSGTSVSS